MLDAASYRYRLKLGYYRGGELSYSTTYRLQLSFVFEMLSYLSSYHISLASLFILIIHCKHGTLPVC